MSPSAFDKVLRPAVVVPESKRVDRLLKEFQQQRYHMAIVSMSWRRLGSRHHRRYPGAHRR